MVSYNEVVGLNEEGEGMLVKEIELEKFSHTNILTYRDDF